VKKTFHPEIFSSSRKILFTVKKILRPEKNISGFSRRRKCGRYLTLRKRGR
jgi:hypothetical protein